MRGCADALFEELAESQAQVLASFRRTIPDMFGKAERFAPELSEIADFVGDGHAERGIYQAMAAFYAVLGADNKGPRREIETLESMMRKER
jgi:L-threonate 2-dehydrogenase